MARSCFGVCLVMAALAAAAGCSGSSKIVVENRMSEPVWVVALPGGGMFIAVEGLDERIPAHGVVRGWLRERVSPPFVEWVDIERAYIHIQPESGSAAWGAILTDQARYEIRIEPGADAPTVAQKLNSRGLSGWRTVELVPLAEPMRGLEPERRIPAKPAPAIPE